MAKFIAVLNSKDIKERIKDEKPPLYVFTPEGDGGKLKLWHYDKDNNLSVINLSSEQFGKMCDVLGIQEDARPNIKKGYMFGIPENAQLKDDQLKEIKGVNNQIQIDQDQVIVNINNYFKQNNYELEANREGICNGLAAVYCKYALEGKENEFKAMLEKIVQLGNSKDNELDLSINLFLQQVLYAYNPEAFKEKVKQRDVMGLLYLEKANNLSSDKLDRKLPIEAVANISANVHMFHWIELFKQIKVDGASYFIHGPKHAISMNYIEGPPETFRLYDPNHKDGFIDCKDETALIMQFSKRFPSTKDDIENFRIPLNVQVVQNPYNPLKKKIPSIVSLISQLPHEYGDNIPYKDKLSISVQKNLEACVEYKNHELLEHWLQQEGANVDFNLIKQAVKNNDGVSFEKLLPKVTTMDSYNYGVLMEEALKKGYNDVFRQIQEKAYEQFPALETDPNTLKIMLNAAASSGHPESLEIVINHYKNNQVPLNIDEEIICAVNAGNLAAVDLLLQNREKLTVVEVVKCLEQAIENNQASMVNYFLDKYKDMNPAKNITINRVDAVEKNLMIINRLQAAGAQLDPDVSVDIKKRQCAMLPGDQKTKLLEQFKQAYREQCLEDSKGLFGSLSRRSRLDLDNLSLETIFNHALKGGGGRTLKVLQTLEWIDAKGQVKDIYKGYVTDSPAKTNDANTCMNASKRFKNIMQQMKQPDSNIVESEKPNLSF